ncbi:sigma cross-reacting protein 27A (SCRP-27A),enhancing lycopene biosynthesis protein 2, with glutamine amidotransferase-like domain [Xenorhabdus bovienii str. Jollieti]|uniref:Glyoxalase n=2 Tax=Xenorhabdus bovienii TaxID=40576 RepID=D3V5P4_XENBS|nr:isoprenoid biosynthesis glyoxalase ElbB [Xenorhabdus bovienii]CBJ82973.1 sigma cross-reacting protein 27A (SCRP-27A), enhancing lycopene biosynthesis protein 2, with glutamine amidotransferase-like domain [Xenorhabdus bovienii SS-2004]CDH07472.1 sigma cross-reacting protein 27A (SCRP-27A),enhancing lycopene biosynthesis protein 2, with glutamine amidotransferase-like domain [Xenorhabdus bovienii str. oregonense]CDH28725.1 sigma cross-reacting protein 27A (SCRP-27A),enhancing lycopene biosynth
MKCVAVILSGCGVYDGSEIHESVLTMLSLSRLGAKVSFFSPDEVQHHVINHLNGKEEKETRHTMQESARITRGNIQPLSQVDINTLDALIIPGGFGVAKNLCNFAFKGSECEINKDLLSIVRSMHQQGKPMGFMCIAPVMVAKILGRPIKVTIGNDPETAAQIEAMGGIHIECPVDDIVIDFKNKIVTTPAYMLAESLSQAEQGIDKLVRKILEMIE